MKTKLLTIATMVALMLGTMTKVQAQAPCLPQMHGLIEHQSASCGVTQMIALATGWNWISTYIDLNEVDGLRMLEEALGDYGITIATYGDQAEYVGDGLWIGLEDYMWTNSEMIMVEVNEDCSVSLEGPVVDPSNVEITVSQGWNWIGYPIASELPIQNALGEFEPEFGDGIANINGLTEFLGEWDGDFATLQPGQGYMYYTDNEGTRSFVFQNGSKAHRAYPNFGQLPKQSLRVMPVEGN